MGLEENQDLISPFIWEPNDVVHLQQPIALVITANWKMVTLIDLTFVDAYSRQRQTSIIPLFEVAWVEGERKQTDDAGKG